MLSVKYVFLIWQETNGGIVILKTVLKSDLWPGSEKCGFNPKFEDNDLKSGCCRVPKLPLLSVKYVCPISHKTNHPIIIPKIVLKSLLWRSSESALNCCIFQLLCCSLHPNGYSRTGMLDISWYKGRTLSYLQGHKSNFIGAAETPGLIHKYLLVFRIGMGQGK